MTLPRATTLIEPPARATQAERRETAENAILEAASRIVAERGLEALTLNEAGEAAGYSRALPAHYFGTRSAMITALADHILQKFVGRVREDEQNEGTLDNLLERVGAYIDVACADPDTLRAYQTILASGLTTPEAAGFVNRLNHDSIDALAGVIHAAREAGDVRADARPRAEASIILAAMRGIMFQWLMDRDYVNLATVRDCLLANIRKSLAP
jgi:AcrR family transcriptional regulator